MKAYQSLQAPATADANPFAVANFLVRKADSVERNEWVELGKSGQKKLVKGIEIWRKKELKAAQEGDKLALAKREQEERDAKRREEAKSVVLVDDATKEAKKVNRWPVKAWRELTCRPRSSSCRSSLASGSRFKLGFTDTARRRSTTSWCSEMARNLPRPS